MVWRTLTNELSITYQTVPALTILGYCLAKSAGQDEKTESNWQKKNSKQSSHSSTPSSYHWKSSSLGMLAGSLIPININQKRHGFVFPIAKTCLATWLLVCFLSRFFFLLWFTHPPGPDQEGREVLLLISFDTPDLLAASKMINELGDLALCPCDFYPLLPPVQWRSSSIVPCDRTSRLIAQGSAFNLLMHFAMWWRCGRWSAMWRLAERKW